MKRIRPGSPVFNRVKRVVAEQAEAMLGRICVDRGLITPEQLLEALDAQSGAFREGQSREPIGAILVRKGYLKEEQLAEILDQQRVQEVNKAVAPGDAHAPPVEVIDAARHTENCFGKYVLVAKIGEGGMAHVWRAWDTHLSRWVALKFLRHASEAEIRRFAREAKLAAKLNHPNIASIFEVGEHGSRYFIAMQFIDGQPLTRLNLALRDALATIRDAAFAVHYAHQMGVIHRDIKPSNIMLEGIGVATTTPALGGRAPRVNRVYMLDFGLAKEETAQGGITQPGAVVGTPAFMSPEQARGDRNVDGRADVYSLGATLYSLVTGRPPFDGKNIQQVVMKVIHEEPKGPRALRPDLPRDLETVLLKAMEKDPSRRYATAEEFGEELRRVLDGEPVAAHESGWITRVTRRWRRKPLRGLVGAALIVAALVAGNVAYFSREQMWRRRERVEGILATGSKIVDQCELSRRVPTASERAIIEAGWRDAERAAPGSGLVALEQARLAVLREEWGEAERAFAKALESYWWPHRVHFQRARMYLRRYVGSQPMPAILVETGGRVVVRPQRAATPAEEEWHRKALEDLAAYERILRDVGADAPTSASEIQIREYARGLALFCRGEYAEAAAVLGRSHAQGDPSGDGKLYTAIAWLQVGRLEDAAELLAEAVERRADHPRLRIFYGIVLFAWSSSVRYAGGDPVPQLERGIEVLRGIENAPDYEVQGLLVRASLRHAIADYRQDRGEDREEDYAAALEDIAKALEKNPGHVEARLRRAAMLKSIARYRFAHRLDGRAALEEALEEMSGLAALPTPPPDVWQARGAAYFERAQAALRWKQDPERDYAASIADYTEALARDATDLSARVGRGVSHLHRALWLIDRKRSAEADLDAAMADFRAALQQSPKHYVATASCGIIHLRRAAAQASAEDVQAEYDRALALLDEALALRPNYLEAIRNVGNAGLERYRRLRDRGVTLPLEGLEKAIQALERALELDSGDPGLHFNIGEACRLLAERDTPAAAEAWKKSLAGYSRAIELNRENADYVKERALTYLLVAQWQREKRQDPESAFQAADNDIRLALRLNGSEYGYWTLFGKVRALRAEWRAKAGKDAAADLSQADRAFSRAIDLDRRNYEPWHLRAMVRFRQQRWAEAYEDVLRAAELDPEGMAPHQGFIESCRKRAEKAESEE